MVDTFISYSRKDIAFAKIVHKSLQDSDIETWIDWQDIAPSVDWFKEIQEAIEQADTFVFIISPTSVKSEVCSKEIAHAEKNNKRLIPIVIGEIDTQEVPSTLLPLNWIFFKEEDQEYAKALQDLATAITMDQPWLKAHTRIQNRALEWDRRHQEKGYLLHGADLAEAEKWLAQASGKDPGPTTLQTQYILASRTEATRRQRLTLSGVVLGLVVAIALGILAWTQRNVAVSESQMRATAQVQAEEAEATAIEEAYSRATQQAIAEAQTITAQSRQLAANAINFASTRLDLATLLSIEGFRTEDNFLTRGSLISTLEQDPLLMRHFFGHEGPIGEMVYDPNGDFLVSCGEDATIRFWDPLTGEQIGDPLVGHEDWIRDIAINPAGTILASASFDKTVRLWDINSHEQITVLQTLQKPTHSLSVVVFSQDGSQLAVIDSFGVIWVWDVNTLTLQSGPITLSGSATNVALSPDLSEVYTASWMNDELKIWDTASGELLDQQEFPGITELEVSPDGTVLAIAHSNIVTLWDIQNKREISSNMSKHESTGISDFAFHPSGKYLFSVNNDLIEVWDPKTGDSLGTFISLDKTTIQNAGNELAISSDGTLLFSSDSKGTIRMWGIYGTKVDDQPFENYEDAVHFAFSSDGKILAATGRIGKEYVIHIWDTNDFTYMGYIRLGGDGIAIATFQIAFHPDNYLIVAGSQLPQGDLVYFYDPVTKEMAFDPLETGGQISSFRLSQNGSQLLTVQSGESENNYEIHVWDLATRQENVDTKRIIPDSFGITYTSDEEGIRRFTLSQDGTVLGMIDKQNNLHLWDVKTTQSLGEVYLENIGDKIIEDVLFSPDNRLLAISVNEGYREGFIILWDVVNGRLFDTVLSIEIDYAYTITFNKDSTLLFSGGTDGGIQLWDIATQQPIGNSIIDFKARNLSYTFAHSDRFYGITGHSAAIYDLILMPGETLLLSLDVLGNIRGWELDPEIWIERACLRAGRNLTQEEWNLYLPFDEYRKTCPQYP